MSTIAIERLHSYDVGNGNRKHHIVVNGTYYTAGMTLADGTEDRRATPPEVVEILERYRTVRRDFVLRLHLGDERGQSWLEECDIAGHIGRSCGSIKVPLLIPPASHGGGAILDACIVRIDSSTRTLWKHPNFHLPAIELRTSDSLTHPYQVWIKKDADMEFSQRAAFHTDTQRQHYLALLRGDRFPCPHKDAHCYGLDDRSEEGAA